MGEEVVLSQKKLGIIAGGGVAPHQLIKTCQQLARPYFVICLEGQADPLPDLSIPHAWISLGAMRHLKEIMAREEIKELILIGRVRRPTLREIRPDWLAFKRLLKIGINSLGDDALLRAVSRGLEEDTGARIIGIQDVMKEIVVEKGVLTTMQPDDQAQKDIERGFEIARALGRLDIGQSVVVQMGLILGVEAIEGTDALIERVGPLRREGRGPVLIKAAKPQQDRRFDLPTIGPETIKRMLHSGLRGVAIEAGATLLLEKERVLSLANEHKIFIVGCNRHE